MIPRIRNPILTITVRVNHTVRARERQRAPARANAAEARVLKTVSFACGHVASEWVLGVGVGEVGYAFAAGVVAGSAGLEVIGAFGEGVGGGGGGGVGWV